MSSPVRVLHVDGSSPPDETDPLEQADDRLRVTTATSASAGVDLLADVSFDAVLSAYDLPSTNGIEFLETVRDDYPELPFLLVAENDRNGEIASEAVAAGVTDFRQTDTGKATELLANQLHRLADDNGSRRLDSETSPSDRCSHVSDAVIALDSDWQFTHVTEPARDVFGKPTAELLGESLWEVVPESTNAQPYDRYHEAIAEGEPRTIEGKFEPWDRWHTQQLYPTAGGLVAEREAVEPWELEPTLYDAIDPDALDAVFRNTRGDVSFEYHGYLVTVDTECNVSLSSLRQNSRAHL